MTIALFVDVDKTLTKNFIQQEFATALNCQSEYKALEDEFQSKQITAIDFGRKIISLFASKNFKEHQAEEIFAKVELQDWTPRSLRLNHIDKFLVSSGPNYYIDLLASKYLIPPENVCRSQYSFNKSTQIIESCDAISEFDKEDFVYRKSKNYEITIGIGDHPDLDAFVSRCTIGFLTVQTERHIYIPNFNSAVLLIQRLSDALGSERRVFPADRMSIPQVVAALNLHSWALLGGGITVVFGVGAFVGKLFQ